MFKSKYVTKGVIAEVPVYLQMLMWGMIDNMEVDEKDYLQIFRLNGSGDMVQKIVHEQEVPRYRKEYYVPVCEGGVVDNKVYVIDDGDYCTMLLAEEY